MAFFLTAYRTFKQGFHLMLFLCAVHLLVFIFYTLFSNTGLSFFKTHLPQNTSLALNQSDVQFNTFEWLGKHQTANLPVCPETSPRLVGPLRVEFNNSVTLQTVIAENPELQLGGQWRPRDCIARQKVAIIIPFRDRESHLKHWLYFLHPILQRQQLDYRVYVICQAGDTIFNKAKLMDAGVLEALKEYDYGCFVFSDVDIIPMDDRNLYRCYSQPRHLAAALDKFEFSLPYGGIFGGVTALSKEQFMKINGFPTSYWGWGGEDDDISYRISFKGMSISRPDMVIGKCKMIQHQADKLNQRNPLRFNNLGKTRHTMDQDGINSVEYEVVHINRTSLYTNITVNVGIP